MIHKLKTINPYFTAVWKGHKTFEIRKNDRNFAINDILYLLEFEPFPNNDGGLYHRGIKCMITYILDNPTYLQSGYVGLGVVVLDRFECGEIGSILTNLEVIELKKDKPTEVSP